MRDREGETDKQKDKHMKRDKQGEQETGKKRKREKGIQTDKQKERKSHPFSRFLHLKALYTKPNRKHKVCAAKTDRV